MAWTHPHMPVIEMETAVELLGQEIAKRVATRNDIEAAGGDQTDVEALTDEIAHLRKRQLALRTEDVAAVQAVFDEFGRGARGH